ncbi:MAG: PAS domain S-box protein, partial [Thermodesulfobacteriota bacterium]|nr:PAS domain S-box protein [Thermodesulfobacteriota bacterium]
MENVELLNEAIVSFNTTALQLGEYYSRLRERVSELDIEIREKNEQLQKNLYEKEEVKNYLNNILESLPTGVIVIDELGKITTFNKTAERITNYSRKETIGSDFSMLMIPRGKKTKAQDFEFSLKRKDKKIIQVRIHSSPLKGLFNEVIGSVFILQDISEIKRWEEQAKRKNKLTAMGEVAVSIAHEIRNPLGSIELFTSILKKEFCKNHDNEKENLVDHILSGVKSLDHIISNLLLFTRPNKPMVQDLDIHTNLKDALNFSQPLLEGHNIQLAIHYSPHQLITLCDKELMKQLFLNLILNAIQAMPEGGKLEVSTKITRSKTKEGNLIKISFADSGKGIMEEDLKKIFNPFFTTKTRGTGL